MRAPTVVIGRVGRPHGVSGAVHSRASGPTLPTIRIGEVLEVRPSAGAVLSLAVVGRHGMPDQPILSFEGVESRDAAAALAGAEIAVAPERVTGLDDPDTFFVRDLVGCSVLLGEVPLGPVREVISAPANDVLEVEGPDGPVLVPFTTDAVTELDVPGRRVVLRADLFGTHLPDE